ncbi:MAG: membrane dipeptidase [Pseudomonadota bacterium]|nr:membrane dipeptidase [Pseudomonadota bacterium]
MKTNDILIIDGLQYVNWNRELFEEAKLGGVNVIHVTIAYWENKKEVIENINTWGRQFTEHSDLIMPINEAREIKIAQEEGKIGIIFGFQNCSPIEDDIRLIEEMHKLGVRIMQLSYNNQSLLATGCYEARDSGITRFGKEAIKEMNRLGMIIDMSHSAELSTLQAIELSTRPIAITHANPTTFHSALRNKSNDVLKNLSQSEGMLGVSLYPFHLANGSDCLLKDFCNMIYDTAELMGIDRIGIGSDLCLNWDYKVLEWMRSGRWALDPDYGEGNAKQPSWPKQPDWFKDNLGFQNIINGLEAASFTSQDIEKIMGQNWLNFFNSSFTASNS